MSATTTITNDDDSVVQKMGYKKELYRGLSFFSNFAIGFTEVAILPSIITTYNQGLIAGGPVTIIWAFFLTGIMTMGVSLCMAEICSAYPHAGCVYYWAAAVSPVKYAPVASYICGWCNFLGNAAGDASFAASFTGVMNAALKLSHGETYTQTQQVFISIFVLFIWSLLNIFRIDRVGYISSFAAFFQAITILAIMFTVACTPKPLNSSDFVYQEYYNGTGFASSSYVGALGLVIAIYCYSGYEASSHMAEETTNSRTAAPTGILTTSLATGIGGIILFITLLYATTSIDTALAGPTAYAGINIFVDIDRQWAIALTWFIVICCFFAGLSSVAVTGRITYALARDNGFPLSAYISKVHPTLFSPVYAIFAVFAFDAILLLLPLDDNGNVAFFSIIGLTVIGFQTSYAIPILLKIIFRPVDFPQTSFGLGGFSIPLGIISSGWLLSTSILAFFPSQYPVTAHNMNWMIIVAAIIFMIAALNWVCNARYHFEGPKRYHENSTANINSSSNNSTEQVARSQTSTTNNPLSQDYVKQV